MKKGIVLIHLLLFLLTKINAQHSVAREWNEQVLEAIRGDFARPTIHARNLFHTSAAMYDAWAAYEPTADTYFLGKTNHGFTIPFRPILIPTDVKAAQEEAMSYAVYRLIKHRFQNAPSAIIINERIDFLMDELGYDKNNTSTHYNCGAAELGNYIAQQIIEFGNQDASNEANDYANISYEPVNPPLPIQVPGNPDILDLNRWQPLELQQFIDQAGNPVGNNTPDFLSPEWGSVLPFSLQENDATNYERDGFTYKVFFDPGPPTKIEDNGLTGLDNLYKWGHTLVAVWSSHLDPTDPTEWDISPASSGNIIDYPTDFADYPNFYNLIEGGDTGTGRPENPKTGLPYEPNIVRRSDYARVLAEFWADGPDSETPPGHWFTILNTVNDHPDLEKKFMGQGEILDDLEWDVKSYFILGGAMHDVAIAAWGIKGWYDYIRPVSAIRGMAEFGQGSDASLPSFHQNGLPLISGFVELIEAGDPLEGQNGEHIGKVKLYAWQGPNYINNPINDYAGVGWIRAAEWWPYQRPSFVTPPFAGYVSGHSTYSRAAAEVLTALTGDAFFPGGMGEFYCPKNEFLVFEEGPTEDITLQWATYRDASDQCSLSRIWGGIHPPVDDIPGRLIGEKIGVDAFNFAVPYFSKTPETTTFDKATIFPNPTNCGVMIQYQQEGNLPFIMIVPQLPMFGINEQPSTSWINDRDTSWIPKKIEVGTPPRVPASRPDYPMIGAVQSDTFPNGMITLPVGWDKCDEDLMGMFDYVLKNYRADKNKIYLSGLSYGGFGTWWLASQHPEMFAAINPVVGWGHPSLMASIAEAQIPVWAISGGRDNVVPTKYFYKGLNQLEALGHKNVRFTIEADMGHDTWKRVYEGEDIYNWMLRQSKN